jgi:hypothetical protein
MVTSPAEHVPSSQDGIFRPASVRPFSPFVPCPFLSVQKLAGGPDPPIPDIARHPASHFLSPPRFVLCCSPLAATLLPAIAFTVTEPSPLLVVSSARPDSVTNSPLVYRLGSRLPSRSAGDWGFAGNPLNPVVLFLILDSRFFSVTCTAGSVANLFVSILLPACLLSFDFLIVAVAFNLCFCGLIKRTPAHSDSLIELV